MAGIVGAGGLAELYALGRLHPVNRVSALEERVDRIARALVYAYRGHRRIRLNGPDGDEIAFSDHEGEYVLTSEDGSVVLSLGTDHPTRSNVIDLAASVDCSYTVSGNEGDDLPIECGDELCDVGETGVGYLRPVSNGAAGGAHDRLGWRVLFTPAVLGEIFAATHLMSVRGDDGKVYTVPAKQGGNATSPSYPACS